MIETDFEINKNVKTVNFEETRDNLPAKEGLYKKRWTELSDQSREIKQQKVFTNNVGKNILTKAGKLSKIGRSQETLTSSFGGLLYFAKYFACEIIHKIFCEIFRKVGYIAIEHH